MTEARSSSGPRVAGVAALVLVVLMAVESVIYPPFAYVSVPLVGLVTAGLFLIRPVTPLVTWVRTGSAAMLAIVLVVGVGGLVAKSSPSRVRATVTTSAPPDEVDRAVADAIDVFYRHPAVAAITSHIDAAAENRDAVAACLAGKGPVEATAKVTGWDLLAPPSRLPARFAVATTVAGQPQQMSLDVAADGTWRTTRTWDLAASRGC